MRLNDLHKAQAIALLLPSALLGGAFAFEYIGGLFPCEMCIWQRWPHGAAILLALLALIAKGPMRRYLVAVSLLAMAISGGIGIFHVGVEQHWWQGLTRCASMELNKGPLLDALWAQPFVRCDAIAWSLFGISMAGYNAIVSLGGAILGAYWLKRA